MTKKPTPILLIEDDASDAWLVQQALDGVSPGEFGVAHADSLETALPTLALQPFAVALLDLSLPGSSGLEALKSLHHGAPQLPVVILTGHNDEALALTALKHGAQDYMVKEKADGHHLKRAIRYAIERKHYEDKLTKLANYDGLTNLPNRALFESRLGMALARSRRSGDAVGVLFLDLNRFKEVNDKHGHEAGDALLKEVAARLTGCLRECDTAARFGGDEFAILLEGAAQPRSCAIVARKIIATLSQPFTIESLEASIGVSIGIAIGMPDAKADMLMQHADAAMYRAKSQPGSDYQFYTGHIHRETVERLQLEQDLALALRDARGLCLYYQPKLHATSGMLAGAEALIRWDHPERGLLSPGEFLPLLPPAMTAELDNWVMETVCRDILAWQAAGLKPFQVSIHISSNQWKNASAMDALMATLASSGLTAQCLAVEIEESAILHSGNDGMGILSRMRETGIGVHLDNFGGDVASLRLLTRCSLDAIKIDRRLTGDMDKDQHVILVHSLIELGHRLGLKMVAEGVETPAQQAALAAMQCDEIQGFVISPPLPAAEFFDWMDSRQARAA